MLFALICTDKPDGLPIRLENRPAHMAYLKSLGDSLKFAGPFLKEDGKTMCGSLVMIEAPSPEAARAIAAADPFAKAGLFETVEIKPWLWVLGKPEGT
ncbi:MAG TPA: YciI-like protein [Methyloceanibacter sp.]|nr:YciI-like protein [Methyloceanibacter sp.]